MEFETVLWMVMAASVAASIALFTGAFGLLEDLGKGGLSVEDSPPPSSASWAGGAASQLEREEEIRQLVQAKHDRQRARGEPRVDVEAEVARLLAIDPGAGPEDERQDAALREEVRGLVIARNERRRRRGEPPLDVEAEIDRQLSDLGR